MLFGRSVFQSVVERLRAEADAEPDKDGKGSPAHRVSGLNMSFAAATAETDDARLRRSEWAYSDILADRPEPSPGPGDDGIMPAYLTVLDADAIAAELAIGETTTIAELHDKRRTFARRNHPDCVSPAFRENATIRMTTANRLIDAALRGRRT
ncbi:hypothetical protein NOF55_05240 [Rhizobiaceae bacterium BDR2-2]|uniref:J domain-containing protein n=1 Tax=Ectorhizobium quercum TaxID=2965071 RepID=A0AAE3SV21_9HYPH|nr:hypothetical protein [Ectorhizobium quercum]MCX8996504.1 hypothetical protein [Ectorhizobium quercum]